MTFGVIRGDAVRLPLPDASVDLIVTSPPYFALRSYTDGGEHYAGQIGSEPTPAAYIAALVECTREWVRVLKPSGSIFVNLGDSYFSGKGAPGRTTVDAKSEARTVRRAGGNALDGPGWGTPRKSLCLLPERYRVAAVDQLGLIARAVIVWAKPNGLPESVTDRVRRSHEDWVHLTRAPRYYAAVDEIREPHTLTLPDGRPAPRARYGGVMPSEQRGKVSTSTPDRWSAVSGSHPLGKLPGSVWEVATEPLKVPERLGVDHFAAFPSEWPRRLILGWSPPGVCTACGEGRRPVVAKPGLLGGDNNTERRLGDGSYVAAGFNGGQKIWAARMAKPDYITGYACACTPYTDHPGTGETADRRDYDPSGRGDHQQGDYGRKQAGEYRAVGPWREYHFDRWTSPPTRPAVILDPFGGTGTTAHVAAALGRIGVTIDLSMDYARVAAAPELYHQRRRKVLGLDRPVVELVPEGQGSLLDLLAAAVTPYGAPDVPPLTPQSDL